MRGGVGAQAVLMLLAGLVAATQSVETVDAQSGAVATLKVDITGNAFSPPDIIVLKGSKVTWTNKDSVAHTVTNDGGRETIDEPFAPAAASPLAVQDYTFNNVGLVKYFCRVHPSMRGTVTVVEQFDADEVPTVPVAADDSNQFLPKLVSLNTTQGIEWTNTGENLHDVTFEDAAIGSLGDLKAGQTLSHNFTKEGTYAYRCKYHSSDFRNGMVGHVAVGGNATLPVVVTIRFPPDGSNVSGNVSIAGTVEYGRGTVLTGVEIGIDGANWTLAEGLASWTYTWDSTNTTEGPHRLVARAVNNGTELGRAEHQIVVANGAEAPPTAPSPSGGGVPGPGAALAALALVWAARRRRA